MNANGVFENSLLGANILGAKTPQEYMLLVGFAKPHLQKAAAECGYGQ
jgi:hypothetical protein